MNYLLDNRSALNNLSWKILEDINTLSRTDLAITLFAFVDNNIDLLSETLCDTVLKLDDEKYELAIIEAQTPLKKEVIGGIGVVSVKVFINKLGIKLAVC